MGELSFRVATTNSNILIEALISSILTGAHTGIQDAQLGAGLIETINLTKMDMLVEWGLQGNNRLDTRDQVGMEMVILWLVL
jgi:hypothetical protein